MGDESPQDYTPEEVAKILRIHSRTVRREIARGNLEAYPVGLRSHRIPHDAVEKYKQRPRTKKQGEVSEQDKDKSVLVA